VRTRHLPSHAAPATVLAATLLAVAGEAAAAGGEGLVILPELPLLVLLLVAFVILIFPLNALVFRPIFNILDERDQRIEGTRARAARLGAEADDSLSRYEAAIATAREELEQDRRRQADEARSAHSARTTAARGEAEQEIARARASVASSLDEARTSLRAQSEGLAREIATRVLGREVS